MTPTTDTWITIVNSDVDSAINSPELQAALNVGLASSAADPRTIVIPDVTMFVRGYIRRRNTLGLGMTVPQELKTAALDIIVYRIANRLQKQAIAESKRQAHDDAIKTLEACARGEFLVSEPVTPDTTTTSAPEPQMETVCPMNPIPLKHRRFGWGEERGI